MDVRHAHFWSAIDLVAETVLTGKWTTNMSASGNRQSRLDVKLFIGEATIIVTDSLTNGRKVTFTIDINWGDSILGTYRLVDGKYVGEMNTAGYDDLKPRCISLLNAIYDRAQSL